MKTGVGRICVAVAVTLGATGLCGAPDAKAASQRVWAASAGVHDPQARIVVSFAAVDGAGFGQDYKRDRQYNKWSR